MKFKNINRKSSEYKYQYIFFYAFYTIFSCIIFSISETVVAKEIISITLVATLYALVISEIIGRINFGLYIYGHIVSIPILILFTYLQYYINEFVK